MPKDESQSDVIGGELKTWKNRSGEVEHFHFLFCPRGHESALPAVDKSRISQGKRSPPAADPAKDRLRRRPLSPRPTKHPPDVL